LFKKYRTEILIFLFSLAVIHGSSFALLDNYKIDDCIDCKTYMGISNGDFKQSPVRRYRVIIPFLASITNSIIDLAISDTKPGNGIRNFSLLISFLVVNNLLMALFGLTVYRLCRQYVFSPVAAIIGLLSVLTCRWTPYLAGLPLTDSLYCLVLATTMLGIKNGDRKLIMLSILLGPWAKESYIFLVPLIFFFSPISRLRQLLLFLLSGILVFGFRLSFDYINGFNFLESLQSDAAHFSYIGVSLKRLFSIHGLYEVFSVTGFWLILIAVGIFNRDLRIKLSSSIDNMWIWYFLIVILHALLSTDLARMLYLLSPLLAIIIAIIIDSHPGLQRVLAVLPGKNDR